MTGHERIDARSLAMHRAIGVKLRANPALVKAARATLERWLERGGSAVPYYLRWREILSLPVEQVAEMLVAESEQMTALRQSSPFAGMLSNQERWAILEEFRA
jgi:hypothetical protein